MLFSTQKKLINYLSIIIFLSMVSLPTHTYAQTCKDTIVASTPSQRFTILGDGAEVKDNNTGLIWQRCSIGQVWQQDTQGCMGEAKEFNWQQALVATSQIGNGYRLPNIKELYSIVEVQCSDPAINLRIFPNTNVYAGDRHWSSSFSNAKTFKPYQALSVGFFFGNINASKLDYKHYIRAVRSE